MTDRDRLPAKLAELIEDLEFADRSQRTEILIETADRFEDVPPDVATRPFPEEHRVQRCESEAYVWAVPENEGLKFHFAVENPQGISAKAMAVILDETLSGEPIDEVARVPSEVVFDIFGKEISMGKGQGLMGMVSMVSAAAREEAARRRVSR